MKKINFIKTIVIVLLVLFMLLFTVLSAFAVEYPACCCLPDEVYVLGSDRDSAVCLRGGGEIIESTTPSHSECVEICNINICTVCKTGSCYDYRTCTPNPYGGICPSGQECCTGECNMPGAPGEGCEDPNLNIKPTTPLRGNDRGYKRISLSWDNNYGCQETSYEILRCTGDDCLPSTSIGTTTQKTFIDTSISWATTYRYIIKGNYPYQGAKDSDVATIYAGDPECEGQTTEARFCVADKHYYCSVANKLSDEVVCQSDQICAGGRCVTPSECNEENGNPFGMYHTEESCEGTISDPKYCFLDRSDVNIDICYSCGGDGMACYDYKSQRTCEKDNCITGVSQNPSSCSWKWIYEEMGIGVCVDEEADNCEFCKLKGTTSMSIINFDAYNDIFDIYTTKKLDALSTLNYPCFESGDTCVSCGDIGCPIYETQSECSKLGNVPVALNDINEFVTSGDDSCKINVCRWVSGMCRKDADGIEIVDCIDSPNPDDCERDYFRPNTTITAVEDDEGAVTGFTIAITDQIQSTETAATKTSADYKTYYCILTTLSTCEPRTFGHGFKETSLRTLAVGEYADELRLCDGACTSSSLILDAGENILRYYSEDPSSNIGLVQELTFAASPDFRPNPYDYYVEDSNYLEGIYYTNNLNPRIAINFSNKAKITFYRLEDSSGKVIELPAIQSSFKLNHLITIANLPDGRYTFSFNAENEYGRTMLSDEQITFVIDTTPPILTIQPDGEVVENSNLTLALFFNEISLLERVYLDGEDLTVNFSTTDNLIFTRDVVLSEGVYTLNVDAIDYAGNSVNGIANFEVNAIEAPLDIKLVRPTYGVSPTTSFEVELKTDNKAICRYSVDNDQLDYDRSSQFDFTDATIHVESFLLEKDSEYELYVKCKDVHYNSITSKSFTLAIDTTPPNFIPFTGADPGLVATDPPFTNLKVTTDDETICNYTSIINKGSFFGYDKELFETSHSEKVFPPLGDASYTYRIDCMNLAELTSSKDITFRVSNSASLTITSKTDKYFPTTTIDLKVGVNLDTNCKYSSDSSLPISEWLSFTKQSTLNHKATFDVQGSGDYTYYVRCYDSRKPAWLPSTPFEITFDIDVTPPKMIYVNDSSNEPNPEITWKIDRLRVKWLGEDNETRISQYYYRLKKYGSSSSEDTLFKWTTETKEDEWVIVDDLNLTDGQKYQFDVKPQNAYGLEGELISSDGIRVDVNNKPKSCSNGEKDGFETDIDCGDGCEGCDYNQSCIEEGDCKFGLYCNSEKKCDYPSCDDDIKNGDESDIDCGGDCAKCSNGNICLNNDDNCQSGYCDVSTGKCSDPDGCHNKKLDAGETGIDCGGPCDACEEGGFCDVDDDCATGMQCIEGICRGESDGDGIMDLLDNCPNEPNLDQLDTDEDGLGDACDDDIDGDGLQNDFESKYNLDPYNKDSDEDGIEDGEEDEDNDGLTNKEEHDNGYDFCLDPWKKDTDGDGAGDKQEVDKKTDPCDANSRPGSLLGLLFLIIFLIIIAAVGFYYGYPKYKEFMDKQKGGKYDGKTRAKLPTLPPIEKKKQAPLVSALQPLFGNNKSISIDEETKRLIEKTRKKKEEKRKGVFSAFGGSELSGHEEGKAGKKISKKRKEDEQKGWVPIPSVKKEKEDVFSKLKEVTKGGRKSRGDTFKKLEKVSKHRKKKEGKK